MIWGFPLRVSGSPRLSCTLRAVPRPVAGIPALGDKGMPFSQTPRANTGARNCSNLQAAIKELFEII